MAIGDKTAADYEALLGLPEVQGFLQAVREAEGTQRSANPYTTGFGFTTISSLDDHPREMHSWGGGKTTAAGAYQALSRSWDEVAKDIGLTDFSPKSQDIFALASADKRGALEDILAGDIKGAVAKTNREWASFPNSPYGQPTVSMQAIVDAYNRGFSRQANTPANMSRTATGFSVSPNVTALAPAVSMMGDTLVSGLTNQTGFTAVPTPTQASRDPTARGYGQLANSLANAEWAGTNLSGTNFGLPAGYTSQVAQRDIVQAAPVEPVTRGGSLPDIATTIDPGRLGAVTNASSTLAAAAPQAATGTSALSTTAPVTGLLDSIALGAAPVGQPSSSLASTATGATNTASNSPANAYGALASSLSQAGRTNLSGTTQTQAPSVVTAAPVSTPAPAATPAPTSVPTTTAPTTTSKTDADFRSGRDKDRAAFDPDPNAKDQAKISIAPTVGRVAGGLLGSMVAGPIGGLLGATLGGKIGSGELGLGGLLGSMAENTDSFTVDNPSGGRGLLDVSGGPVTLGSFTATPTRSSGGYKGFDTNTNWSSYTSPLGITTTMVGDNIVGGPGLSPAAGGNAAGFK